MSPSGIKTQDSLLLPCDIWQQANCIVQVTTYSSHSQSHRYSYGPGQLTVYPLLNLYMPVDTAEGLGPTQKKSNKPVRLNEGLNCFCCVMSLQS